MGVLIRMGGKTFRNEFMKEQDTTKFTYAVVSQQIVVEGEDKRVNLIPQLIPPRSIISILINETEEAYQHAFLQFIQSKRAEQFVTAIVTAVVKEGHNMVLLCSQDEEQYMYIDLICDYIEEVYKLKTYTYKKFKKDPEKATTIKNPEVVNAVVAERLEEMAKMDANQRDEMKEKLSQLEEKDLRKMFKKKGLEYDKSWSKKKLVKVMAKALIS